MHFVGQSFYKNNSLSSLPQNSLIQQSRLLFVTKNTNRIDRKLLKLWCLIKEKQNQIAFDCFVGLALKALRENKAKRKEQAKQAKGKGPAVSDQGNQGLNIPNKHVCFSVAFLISLSKKGRTELLWTRVLQFLSQEKEDQRSKFQGSCSFLSKEPLSKGAPDMNELHCCICNLNIHSFAYWYILKFSNWMFVLAIPQFLC